MQQKFENLAKPIQIGRTVIKNRIWMAPMMSRLCTMDGEVTQTLIDHYVARAKGEIGLIVLGSMNVDNKHLRQEPAIGIYSNKFGPGLYRLVDAVHKYEVPILAQLIHTGPLGMDPVSPSDFAVFKLGEKLFIQPRIMSIAEIEEARDRFIEAAVRAETIGFDGIQLHGAGGYLIAQFFSPRYNRRTDKYGGCPENRMRFALEIVRGIRQSCSPNFIVSHCCAPTDVLPDSFNIEDSLAFAKALEQEGVSFMDYHLVGSHGTFHYEEGRGHCQRQKKGQFDISAKFTKELHIPVITRTAGEWNPEVWEDAVKKDAVDAVAVGRLLLADPDVARKIIEGRVEDIRPCMICNHCNETGSNIGIKECVCSVNSGLGKGENDAIKPAQVVKKVLVVGGGPGGLEAARVAAMRGHDVTLLEKEATLGGAVLAACVPIGKGEYLGPFIKWEERQCRKLGVKIELNKEATAQVIQKIKPDVVFTATGAKPIIPSEFSVNKNRIFVAEDVLTGKAVVKGKVVVIGGGLVGIETADFMVEKGITKDVTVLEKLPVIASGMDPVNKAYFMRNVLPKIGLKVFTNMIVTDITDKSVVAFDKDGQKHNFEADYVILAVGYTPNKSLYESLVGKVPELYNIGDSRNARKIPDATHDAWYFARQI